MSLQINLRHVEEQELQLNGEISAVELQLETLDELIQARRPLFYDLVVQKTGDSILARGKIEITLDCTCARCLKPFQHAVCLEDWAAHLPLEGPEKAQIKDDLVDLTPFVREDILLEFPQRPLCGADCPGLAKRSESADQRPDDHGPAGSSPAWSELNKLQF
jgi:uncharacterized protein